MNRLKINALSIFALAFFSANSLSAAGVVEYDSTVDGSYDAAIEELSTITDTTTTDYTDGYTLTLVTEETPAASDDVVITKYLADENGTLTAVQFIVTKDDDYDVVRQVTSGSTVSMNFIGLSGTSSGLAINNSGTATSSTIVGDFVGNSLKYTGGGTNAVFLNTGAINSITGDFISNYSTTSKDGKSANGGALFNYGGTIELITGDFIGNYARVSSGTGGGAKGGAIWNYNGATITAIEGSFINNFAQSHGNGSAVGGAVLNTVDSEIGFLAINTDTEFTGNFTRDGTVYTSNAIANTGTVNFNAYEGHTITVNDGIDNTQASGTLSASVEGTININDSSVVDSYSNYTASKVIFNNKVQGQNITVYAGTLELGSNEGGLEFNTTSYTAASASSAVSYTTEDSTANLVNSTILINDGATLQIAASGVSFDSNSSLTLEDGATLILDAASSLIFNSDEDLAISVSEGDFSIAFNVGAGSSIIIGESSYDIYDFLNDADTLATLFGTDASNIDMDSDVTAILNESDAYGISTMSLDTESDEVSEAYILTLSGNLSADGVYTVSIATAAVPEPSTYAMIFGVIALGFAYYRRRK